jgi:NADH-quinone oxidoreductase subunit H
MRLQLRAGGQSRRPGLRGETMNLTTALARLLVFPGVLFAVPFAWFFLWVERKAVARMQGRIGPPFMQPFLDFIKLLGKDTPVRGGAGGLLMRAWPLLAVSAAAGAVGLLPVLPSSGGFEGDLILLLALLEVPSMCIIAAGFSSRSIFGEIGSAREAVLSVAYNVVFLLAIVSIAASQHTFRLETLAQLPPSFLRYLGIAAILVCLPAKLHLNPFSLPNAEQEIYSGPMTEYAGPELAMWELSHGLEWVAATGLVATLAAPHISLAWLAALLFVALSFVVVLLLSVLAAATARLAIDTTVRFYWQCTLIFAVLAISSALFMRFRS